MAAEGPERLRIRAATAADLGVLAETVQEGFESYREWAPVGWEPPEVQLHEAGIRERLVRQDCWCVLALAHDGAAGQAGLVAGDQGAHLWMLFVRRRWWGTGLAGRLHAAALATARERGSAAVRLHTPSGHARARAFYERRGWAATGERHYEPLLGLEVVEYRRGLD